MIKTAVIPVAGLGTRCLPASKSIPKEMLTLVDRPVIDYVVKEALAAGVEKIIFVTHPTKIAIEHYFQTDERLENSLKKANKLTLLKRVQEIIPPNISFEYVLQTEPLGLGHAILCAQELVGNQPFAILLPDVVIRQQDNINDLWVMSQRFEQQRSAQIMVEEVALADVSKYGVVDVKEIPKTNSSVLMSGVVEKPSPENAPSNLAVVGRYVLPARIMDILPQITRGAGGEIQLTDAIAELIKEQAVEAYLLNGQVFDCGNPAGYLKAIVNFASHHPSLAEEFKQQIQHILDDQ